VGGVAVSIQIALMMHHSCRFFHESKLEGHMKRLFLFFLILVAGCGSQENKQADRLVRVVKYAEAGPSDTGDLEMLQTSQKEDFQPQERMVIKTADLNCEVANYEEALAQIQTITSQYRGFIVTSRTTVHDNNVKSGNVNIRIDSSNFETALHDIKKLVKKIENESVAGNDVTEEFYDLTARLENKRRAEKRFQEILAIGKTTKGILEVEQALARVREEIERLEGRKRYLSDQVTLSTINVNLHEPFPLVATGKGGFLAKARRGFERGIAGFADVMSHIITTAIAGIPIFFLVFILFVGAKKYLKTIRVSQTVSQTQQPA
jgi:exonuclease VII small subunit